MFTTLFPYQGYAGDPALNFQSVHVVHVTRHAVEQCQVPKVHSRRSAQ